MAKLDTVLSHLRIQILTQWRMRLFRNNKTNEWLHSKCESDKNNIIKTAMINKSDIIIKK